MATRYWLLLALTSEEIAVAPPPTIARVGVFEPIVPRLADGTMPYESNVQPGRLFAGQRVVFRYEVFSTAPTPANPNPPMLDATTLGPLTWALRKAVGRLDPHRRRAPGPAPAMAATDAGITVAGTFNATRSLNEQRVDVDVVLPADLEGALYVDALERQADGHVVSYGSLPIFVAATT